MTYFSACQQSTQNEDIVNKASQFKPKQQTFIFAMLHSTSSFQLLPTLLSYSSQQSYLILFYHQNFIFKTILTMNQIEAVDDSDPIEEAKSRLKVILKTSSALSRWKKLYSASKDRFNRLKELITTQEDYYNDLKTLQEKIKAPLINNKIVPNKKATQMFNNLQNMIQLSFQMKTQLSKKFQKWDRRTTVIGQTMAIFAKFLLVYSDYFKNLNETQRIMKQLSLVNPEVRQLEKNLSTENKIITIDGLLMKPFQRSLKYHLILKDYFAKLDQKHPDYEPLKKAIEIYREVNEKNNNQLQHKEKDQILIDLDSKFGHIIDVDARRYVATYSAFLIQTPITMFVFSDLILLATKEKEKGNEVEREHSRISLNKYSLITLSKNEKHFRNGLFLYGKKNCAYLRFEKESERDEVFLEVRNIIKKIYENQHNRQSIMALRITRNSTERNSLTSPQDQPQFSRPLICTVVGFQKRKISQDKLHFYFVVEFKASPKDIDFKSSPKQISLLSWQKLLKIEAFIHHKYPKIDLFPLNYLPKGLTLQTLSQDQSLKFQLHSISIQIFLNSIFRNHTTLKKLDIICRNLDICDSLWRHMGSSYSQLCFCEFCIKEKYFKSYESYEAEVQKRLYLCQQKKNGKGFVELCEIRTINSQMMITEIPVAELKKLNSVQRINWVKAKKGLINHTLTNVRPFGPYVNVISLKVFFFSIKGEQSIELQVHPNSRIKHIVDRVGKILKFDVSDYTLQLHMEDSNYLLNDDQIIRNVYIEPHQHQGIVSKFFALFSEENFGQKFYLRKNWVLEPALEVSCTFQKLFHEVQEAIYRIRTQQLRLSCEQIYSIAAYYFAFTHYLQLDILNAGMIERKRQELTLLLPPKYKEKKFTAEILQKIKQIQQNKRVSKQDLLKCIIKIVCTKPGWSCILFFAVQKSIEGYYIKKVRMGCDFIGVKVINQEAKGNIKYEFKIQDNKWSYKLIGHQLIITTPQRQFSFKGRQMWKVKQQIQFYHTYYRNFRKL